MKIIPPWAITLAAIAFVAAQIFFNLMAARQAGAPPAWARVLLGLALGVVVGCYLLLIGYVNRDAGRRAMSPLLWTIVAVFIPNGLGILLYFILRQPLPGGAGANANSHAGAFNSCPRCGYIMNPGCPQCQRTVSPGDSYCRYCGTSLEAVSRSTDVSPIA